jgi:hypothetical protein
LIVEYYIFGLDGNTFFSSGFLARGTPGVSAVAVKSSASSAYIIKNPKAVDFI